MRLSPRFNSLDRVVAGLWWWKLRRGLAEIKIGYAKTQAKTDQAYQEWKYYEFACRFGRATEMQIANAVVDAEKNGADANALSLLVTNQDVLLKNGQLQYRTGSCLKATGYLASTVCLAGSVMFATLLALAPMPLFPKLLAFLVIFALLICGAYVFKLYTSRPLAAANKLRAISEQAMQAKIVSLHAHPGFKAVENEGHLK